MKIAIVHDYLYQYGGAEKVIEKWLQMYPQADLYTSIYLPDKFKNSEEILKADQEKRIYTSFAQKIVGKNSMIKFFKHFFWLYPLAMSKITIKDYDLVLINSTYCAKNIKIENCRKIIHYCHTPTRFLHDLTTEVDHKTLSKAQRILIPVFKFWLKKLDLKASEYLKKRGTIWFGNSEFTAKLSDKIYHTRAGVLYPPVELDSFLKIKKNPKPKEKFYLSHGRVSFHKRIDLAIKACLKMNRKLKISGVSGFLKEMEKLEKIVEDAVFKDPKKKGLIEFLGRTTDQQYHKLLADCQAFLFPGKEDFGIAPIEVLASGTPVVAYQDGGALEYIQDGLNGVFFAKQTVSGLTNAIHKFEQKDNWNHDQIKKTSKKFSEQEFRKHMQKIVESL